jgi:hypothetical protein
MEWMQVQSSAVSALGYDLERQSVGIEFKNGQVYVYGHVPYSEFEPFLAAESKGRYLTLIFLPKNYPCRGPYRSRREAQNS